MQFEIVNQGTKNEFKQARPTGLGNYPNECESYPHGKIEAELQQHLSWLHNLQLGEPSVPVPPIRITESYRVFPPEWDVDDEFLALDDASFLFGEELR